MQKRDYEVRVWREERDGKLKTIVATARHSAGYNGAMYGVEAYGSWAMAVEDASSRVHTLYSRFGIDHVGYAAAFDKGRFYNRIWVPPMQKEANLADALESRRIADQNHFQLVEETVDLESIHRNPSYGIGWGHIQAGYLCAGAGGPNSLRLLNLTRYRELT